MSTEARRSCAEIRNQKPMANSKKDLHGNAPDKCSVALLIVDMINDFEFPGSDALLRNTLPAVPAIAQLKKQARKSKVPVIYANDNFGKWRSDFRQQVQHCLKSEAAGKPIVALLKPDPDDYFVLKAKHSAFFATPLELLLEHLGTKVLVLVGVSGDSCITFTAHDAYMRGLSLVLPRDAIASMEAKENRACLERLERVVDATVVSSREVNFERLKETCGIKNK